MSTITKDLINEQLKELDSKYSEDFRVKLIDKIKDELLWACVTASDATRRKVLHTNLADCETLYTHLQKLKKFVDNYENVLKGEVDSYSAEFIKKELKSKVSNLIINEIDNLNNDELSFS
jgi:uncharacterized membrane protein YheB (UPF0754 family)